MNGAKGHVLITGAAIRVGRAIALALANVGWDITIHYNTSKEDAENLATEVRALERRATIIQANLENTDEVAALIQERSPYLLTALINNASLFLHDTEDPDGRRQNAVNFEAPCHLTQALFEQLPAGIDGSVLHILDSTPVAPTMTHYGESRAKLRGEVAKQAKAFSPRMRVNAIEPGPTLINPGQSEVFFKKLVDATLLKHVSRPEDIATAALLLTENPSITGQRLMVDSGMHLFSV